MDHHFDHENLDVYRLALEVARWCRRARLGPTHLRSQLTRAADSVVLNVAEGRARGGDAGRNHYRVALGSAAEACAALDLTTSSDAAVQQAKLRRVGAMLRRLSTAG